MLKLRYIVPSTGNETKEFLQTMDKQEWKFVSVDNGVLFFQKNSFNKMIIGISIDEIYPLVKDIQIYNWEIE